MAHAKETTTVVRVVKEEVIEGVSLGLTLEEAKTLLIIFSRIGGDPKLSLRKHTNSMYNALYEVGALKHFNSTSHKSVNELSGRAIYFLNNVGV